MKDRQRDRLESEQELEWVGEMVDEVEREEQRAWLKTMQLGQEVMVVGEDVPQNMTPRSHFGHFHVIEFGGG